MDDDIKIRSYQDDLDASDRPDPIANEASDDPTKELGVSPRKFREELDKYAFDEAGNGDDDMREEIEDRDDDSSSREDGE